MNWRCFDQIYIGYLGSMSVFFGGSIVFDSVPHSLSLKAELSNVLGYEGTTVGRPC